MRQTLGWTDRDEAGKKWEIEAYRNRNHWEFTRRANRRMEWEVIEEPSVTDWENLLDLIERKYQRRRCAWRDVEQVQKELEQAKQNLPNL
jgi:hypothetical protein